MIPQIENTAANAFIQTAEHVIYAIEHCVLCTARTAEVCHLLVIHLHVFLFYMRYSPLGYMNKLCTETTMCGNRVDEG